MKTIEKNIDYNEKTDLYRLRITINGKRKSYYSHIYEEVKTLKEKINDIKINTKSNSKLNNAIKEIEEKYTPLVYFISDGEFCKIGVTMNIKERIKSLQTGSSRKLKLLTTFKGENSYELEKFLHHLFYNKHVTGEWYDILFLFDGEKQ